MTSTSVAAALHLVLAKLKKLLDTKGARREAVLPVIAALEQYLSGQRPFCLGSFSRYRKHFRRMSDLLKLKRFFEANFAEWLKLSGPIYQLNSVVPVGDLLSELEEGLRELEDPTAKAYADLLSDYYLGQRELPLRWLHRASLLLESSADLLSVVMQVIISEIEDDDFPKLAELDRAELEREAELKPFEPLDIKEFLPPENSVLPLDNILSALAAIKPRTEREDLRRYQAMEGVYLCIRDACPITPEALVNASQLLGDSRVCREIYQTLLAGLRGAGASIALEVVRLRKEEEQKIAAKKTRRPDWKAPDIREALKKRDSELIHSYDAYQVLSAYDNAKQLLPTAEIQKFLTHVKRCQLLLTNADFKLATSLISDMLEALLAPVFNAPNSAANQRR